MLKITGDVKNHRSALLQNMTMIFLTFPLKSVEGSSNKYPDITIDQVHGRAKTIQKKMLS